MSSPMRDFSTPEVRIRVEGRAGRISATLMPVDLVILEVGMGGRLDAVNAVDADLALITSIDLAWQAEAQRIAQRSAELGRAGLGLLQRIGHGGGQHQAGRRAHDRLGLRHRPSGSGDGDLGGPGDPRL